MEGSASSDLWSLGLSLPLATSGADRPQRRGPGCGPSLACGPGCCHGLALGLPGPLVLRGRAQPCGGLRHQSSVGSRF